MKLGASLDANARINRWIVAIILILSLPIIAAENGLFDSAAKAKSSGATATTNGSGASTPSHRR